MFRKDTKGTNVWRKIERYMCEGKTPKVQMCGENQRYRCTDNNKAQILHTHKM